jgi:prepilin-type N-terminal cleavage/methylation domain-containing protein
MKTPRNRVAERGFTLLELVITAAMVLILVTTASLNASTFLGRFRLGSAARQVATDLRLARTKAITQGSSYRVRFTAGSSSYTVERWDGAAWQPHALYSKQVTAGGAAPLELARPVRSLQTLDVQFQARGNATGERTIPLQDPGVNAVTRSVFVSFAGQVAIQ